MRSCPKCKTTDYNNRFFSLMINICGHSLCKNCVDNLFARNSAPCPTCGKTLKKNAFWEQTFDDPAIEKEVYFRKKLRKTFNLNEEDFDDLRQFNDYLENVENLVFNLVHDVEVTETWAKIEQFRVEHEELIGKNRKKKSRDELWVEAQLEEERRFRGRMDFYGQQDMQEDNKTAATADDAKALLEELKNSDLPAELIVDQKRKRQIEMELNEREEKKKRSKLTIKRDPVGFPDSTVQFAPIRMQEGQSYIYEQVVLDYNGPILPDMDMLAELNYLNHIRLADQSQLAGGYEEKLGCYRALFDSRQDILLL